MGSFLRLFSVVLVALALWCAGGASLDASDSAGAHVAAHDEASARHHDGDPHPPAAHVHASCALSAAHCIAVAPDTQAVADIPDAGRVVYPRPAAALGLGLRPEAQRPPPRA